jgi:hypothetical protein
MGSGYKTFTAGAVLTASDVQNYLQDQSVMVFGGTAARSSAIGTANFEEGMLTYLTDVDKLQVYTGATFADVYPPATSNQGLTLINTTAFSGVASQAINPFSATYDVYRLLINITACTADAVIYLKMRSGSTDASSDAYQIGRATVTRTGTLANDAQNDSTLGWYIGGVDFAVPNTHGFGCVIDLHLPFAVDDTILNYVGHYISSTGAIIGSSGAGAHFLTTSYDGVNLITSAGNITGSISVYGYNK